MILNNIFNFKKICEHLNVSPEVDYAYCPDCGELVENQWYLVRCACCGVKLPGIIKNGVVIPEKHYCHNCGCKDFVVERINKINFIDIRYAVLVKAIVDSDIKDYTQSWVNKDVFYGKKYISCGT